MHNQTYHLIKPCICHSLDVAPDLFFLGNKHYCLHLYFYIVFFLRFNPLSYEFLIKYYNHLFQVVKKGSHRFQFVLLKPFLYLNQVLFFLLHDQSLNLLRPLMALLCHFYFFLFIFLILILLNRILHQFTFEC